MPTDKFLLRVHIGRVPSVVDLPNVWKRYCVWLQFRPNRIFELVFELAGDSITCFLCDRKDGEDISPSNTTYFREQDTVETYAVEVELLSRNSWEMRLIVDGVRQLFLHANGAVSSVEFGCEIAVQPGSHSDGQHAFRTISYYSQPKNFYAKNTFDGPFDDDAIELEKYDFNDVDAPNSVRKVQETNDFKIDVNVVENHRKKLESPLNFRGGSLVILRSDVLPPHSVSTVRDALVKHITFANSSTFDDSLPHLLAYLHRKASAGSVAKSGNKTAYTYLVNGVRFRVNEREADSYVIRSVKSVNANINNGVRVFCRSYDAMYLAACRLKVFVGEHVGRFDSVPRDLAHLSADFIRKGSTSLTDYERSVCLENSVCRIFRSPDFKPISTSLYCEVNKSLISY